MRAAAITVYFTNGATFVYDYNDNETEREVPPKEALEVVTQAMDNRERLLKSGALMGIERGGGEGGGSAIASSVSWKSFWQHSPLRSSGSN